MNIYYSYHNTEDRTNKLWWGERTFSMAYLYCFLCNKTNGIKSLAIDMEGGELHKNAWGFPAPPDGLEIHRMEDLMLFIQTVKMMFEAMGQREEAIELGFVV